MQDQQPGRLTRLEGLVRDLTSAHYGMHVSQVGNRTQDLHDPGIVQITHEADCWSGCVHAALVRFSGDRVSPLTEREQAGNCERGGDCNMRKVRGLRKKLYPNRSSLT